MEFRLLGAIEARRSGQPVHIGQRRERQLLAALLLHPGPVPTERLVALLWPDTPPRDPRAALHAHVSRLRGALATGGVGLTLDPRGYRVDAADVDVHRLRALHDHAVGVPDPAERSRLLGQALALDRGPLCGADATTGLRALLPGLDDLLLSAVEARIEADLARGRHRDLGPELAALTARHPLRERTAELQIRAAHRTGDRAAALAGYERIRSALADTLGLDPGPELRRTHAAVLREATADRPTPAQLPPQVADFTGRTAQLDTFDALLGSGRAVVLHTIAGVGGVGKTALAVYWAHHVRAHFPDGQLHINLHGYSAASPVTPLDALSRFLRALGVAPENVPTDVEEATSLYHSRLAGRRILILLDNAGHPDQVRPLLPADPGSLALITSRDRLAGLTARDGARRLNLSVLEPEESVRLLGAILGADRVAAEPTAAARIAELCGHLPLALRITAAHVADTPGTSLAEHAARLGSGGRIDALELGDDPSVSVRVAFGHSYAALDPESARVFRLLGLVPGPDFTPEAVAALTGTSVPAARRSLDRLASAHLVEAHPAHRYAFHDLMREYAAEHGTTESDAGHATSRLFSWYLRTAEAASQGQGQMTREFLPVHLDPPPMAFPDPSVALLWLDAEYFNLRSVIHHCCTHEAVVTALLLTEAIRGYMNLRRHCADYLSVTLTVHGLIPETSDPRIHALAEDNLGTAYRVNSRHNEAVQHLTSGLHWIRRVEGRPDEARFVVSLGMALRLTGRMSEALDNYHQALDLFRPHNFEHWPFLFALSLVSEVHRLLGAFGKALDTGNEALVFALRHKPSLACYLQEVIATVHIDRGACEKGLELARAALELSRTCQEKLAEPHALNALGAARRGLGHMGEARLAYTEALLLVDTARSSESEVETLCGLAGLDSHDGAFPRAVERARRAVDIAHRCVNVVGEGRARATLAEVHLSAGDLDLAATEARRALAINESTGHRLGEARSLRVLGLATTDPELTARAREIRAQIGAAPDPD
ncbi:BTAD domain-containing putative transcriptional regulator [Longispora sp. NPDC051575]|uniref:AfsR/SARP family transcriptional regulator n=1 Tax=Longispora sp. NPDC051575 TaxID=3154943 RepID=UPI00342AA11E